MGLAPETRSILWEVEWTCPRCPSHIERCLPGTRKTFSRSCGSRCVRLTSSRQISPSIPGRSGSGGGSCIAPYGSASVRAWLDSCSREEKSYWSATAKIPKGCGSACPTIIPFGNFHSRSDVFISRTGNGCIGRISATPLAMYTPSAFPFCRAWRKRSPGAAQYTHT
jgi:hypothetical protein